MLNLVSITADLSTVLENILLAGGNPLLLCVLGSHLLIHLKETAEDGRDEGTSYRSKSLSTIGFEQGAESSEPGEY